MIVTEPFSKLISTYTINSFTQWIKKTPFQHFRQIQRFDKKIIQPILAESQQLRFVYSKQLKSLFVALNERIQFNLELIKNCPTLQTLIISLSQNVKGKYKFLQIANIKTYKLNFQQLPEYKQKRLIEHDNSKSQNILLSENMRKASYFDKIEFFQQAVSIIQVEDISKIDVIPFTSIYQIYQRKFEIVKTIGAMINSGGGLILFACQQHNYTIIANGQTISHKSKRNIYKQFESCLSCFYPKLSFKDNVELKFIPITKYQFQNHPSARQYIKDMYVAVLQLSTNYPEKTIFSLIENQKIIFKRKQGKTIQLKGQECHKYIKAKFYKRYITQQEEIILQTTAGNSRISLFLVQDNTRIQHDYNPYKPILDSYRLQQRFNYVSAVSLHGCILQTVMNHLTFKNIRNFRFYACSNSIIKNNREIKIQREPVLLFHMTTPKKFKELFQSCPTTSNDNGHVELKNITDSIKLNRPLLKEQFDEALQFLKKKKSTEYLIYYQLIGEESFYLQTGSKVSSFYLYEYLKLIGFNCIKFKYIEDFSMIKGMRKKFSSSQTS